MKLRTQNLLLYQTTLSNVHVECQKWDAVLIEMQKQICEHEYYDVYKIKPDCHVRFCELHKIDLSTPLPSSVNDVGRFVQVSGTVVRMTNPKVLEYTRDYYCARCKQTIVITGIYEKLYCIDAPKRCKFGCLRAKR